MFNINKLLTKISDAKSPSPTKPPSPSETSAAEEATAEGFLCPSCLRAFPSAGALQDHYETSHGSDLEVVCPTCRMRLGSEVELESHCTRHHAMPSANNEAAAVEQLQRQLADLHVSLREERSCSEELRTEVSRLHGAVLNKGDTVEAEMLRSQVRALEEGKALLTSELVLARQQLGSDLQQARMEAAQLRTQLEQMLLQAQPTGMVEKLSQSVQTENAVASLQQREAEPMTGKETRAALASLTAEKQTLQLKLEEARMRADKREAQHREALARSEAERQRLLDEVEAGRTEHASLATSLEVAKQGLDAAASRAEELEAALALEQQRGSSEIQAHQVEVEELRSQLAQLSAVEAALRDSAQAAQTQLAEYRAQAEMHAEQLARLTAQLKECECELCQCREQLATSHREAQASREELVAGRAEKVELAQAVQALHLAKSRLADQLSALELEVGNLRNSQVALEADRAAFELEAEQLRKSHAAHETGRAALEAELAAVQQQRDCQASNHQQVLQGLQAELTRVLNRAAEACLQLEAEQQRSARQEAAVEALREQLASEQATRQAAQTQLDAVQGDKLELEAKLDNAMDERRALLDRCLRSEAEAETLRTSAADVRRRLDDTLAALHELGRENQLLQMDNAKHQGRKWADDSQVTHCTGCEKLFTVTIRKHHCRNCGNIFCNECSSKSAATASSKKPVRVCENCYSELIK